MPSNTARRLALPDIALIHALRHSPPPIMAAFADLWPEARLMNLLDDSLSADLAEEGSLTTAMTSRFLSLADYARKRGVDGILFTCSAFGPAIDEVKAMHSDIPVLKPNEAMIADLAIVGSKIGLLATFSGTLASMPSEFPASVSLRLKLADGALAALDSGDPERHDRIALETARDLADCDAIALAQFSLSRAAPLIARETKRPVYTTPHSAVRRLRELLS